MCRFGRYAVNHRKDTQGGEMLDFWCWLVVQEIRKANLQNLGSLVFPRFFCFWIWVECGEFGRISHTQVASKTQGRFVKKGSRFYGG